MRRLLAFSLVLWLAGPSLSSAIAEDGFPDVDQLPVIEELPDPLVMFDGTPVTSAEQWRSERRPELIALFEHYMFGKAPPPPENFAFTVDDVDPQALGGKATRKIVTLRFGPEGTPPVSLLLVVPNGRQGPAPVFIGLNFVGNHTTLDDPAIPLTEAWVNNSWSGGSTSRAEDDQRGIRGESGSRPRWYFEKAVDRGYAVATMYAGELSPDYSGGGGGRAFTEGIHQGWLEEGQTWPGDTQWHTIAAWAWGLSRGVDYLVQDEHIDSQRIAVLGHSRLGKTALWAGATDSRFALIVSNNSGCGGAALHRRRFGETVARINQVFPHWFNARFKTYNEREDAIPFDQHQLIACLAPRPVYVASASEDLWADPRGEFLSVLHASPVYSLYGVEGFGLNDLPPVDTPCLTRLGYHLRSGPHEILEYDWQQFLRHARRHGLGQALTQD